MRSIGYYCRRNSLLLPLNCFCGHQHVAETEQESGPREDHQGNRGCDLRVEEQEQVQEGAAIHQSCGKVCKE